MAELLPVTSPDGQYDIVIQPGLFADFDAAAYGLDDQSGRVAVITNATLADLYRDVLGKALPHAAIITVPDGEVYKTLTTVEQMYNGLIDAGLDRRSTVLAFGGGVIGDMAGFAAATYMRGIRFVQAPTSLLAMVDSSVGGKVGVDLPQGKNLVGAFKQPDVVLIDTDLLKTLPARERSCGMAEIVKHGLLADAGLLEMVDETERDAELVRRAVQVKIDVVQVDPFEHGIRAHLNLGHTFGHAIEHASHYAFAHGEAVGIGLVAAATLSVRLRMADAALIPTVRELVESVGLPTKMGDLDPETVYSIMGTDKKKQSGKLRFILLRGIEQAEIVEGVDKADVIAVLEEIR